MENYTEHFCKICGNRKDNKVYAVKEMMFGLRQQFDYLECGECGCLQIITIPTDMDRHYPSNYYSFGDVSYTHHPFKIFLKKKLIQYKIYKEKTLIGKLLSLKYRDPEDFYPWLETIRPAFDAAILDVGCGSGRLLIKLQKSGFTNLRGADPFIKNDITYEGGLTIYKKSLQEMGGEYDLIILNHSFEHMEGQEEILAKAQKLLKPGGCLLVRIPIAGTYAWKTYGVNWVQLDAPRHFYLHTTKSMEVLKNKLGFRKMDVVFDSNDLQFWGSEQYIKDIPLRDPRSYAEAPDKSLFSKEQIESFREKAKALNAQQNGDAACFYLYK